ncbi:hypothetical protein [Phaffia rhodozyma]|uniref:Uncharacterized protein n=1 Tax=Phaffia rhodozyma TaxID=264483 RepID=A0A0F7SV49_PHARH|nr:hypothetical protein [Phaffia rhodozyma]
MTSITATLQVTISSDPLHPAPHPAKQITSYPLPSAKPTLPTPIPSDPLSDKAEVKAVAEPTSTYGPLLEAMKTCRDEVNSILTDWKEWEDSIGEGVQEKKKKNKGKNIEEDEDDDEEDDE